MRGKGHVPEHNLHRYRMYVHLARQFNSLGNQVSGLGDHREANALWALAGKYKEKAQELRVDLPSKLKQQLLEVLPQLTTEEIDTLVKIAEDAGRRIGQEGGINEAQNHRG